jgi:hypothetical protein
MMPVAMLMATPRVRLIKPPPGRYGIEDLWKATVISDTACDAWFEGFVFEETRGQVFHATTKPFPLSRGTKVYGYRDVRINQTQTEPGYEAFVTRSGTLPNGKYRFKLILVPFGVGDSFGFEVKPMGPPRLISPRDGDTIRAPYPQFIWTPPNPKPTGLVTYELKLVEVMTGQTLEEALRANPPWFIKSGIVTTSLRYPVSARPLLTPGLVMANTGSVTGKVNDKEACEPLAGSPQSSDTLDEAKGDSPVMGTAGRVLLEEIQAGIRAADEVSRSFAWQASASAGGTRVGESEVWGFSTSNVGGPKPLTGGSGVPDATIVWQHQDNMGDWDIWYADIVGGVPSSAPLYEGPGHDHDPAIAFDRSGTATVVWAHKAFWRFGIWYSRRPAGGNWSTPAPISLTYPYNDMDPAVAFGENGTGLCIWVRQMSSNWKEATRFWYSTWNGTSWSAPAEHPGWEPATKDSSQLPELAFYSDPAAPKRAVAIGVGHGAMVGYSIWDGVTSSWSKFKALLSPTPRSVGPYYQYLQPTSLPASARLGLASCHQTCPDVRATWTSQGPPMERVKYSAGHLSTPIWYPATQSIPATSQTSAVCIGPTGSNISVYVNSGRVYSEKPPGSSQQPASPPGMIDTRPAVAWLKGTSPLPMAVWGRDRPGFLQDIYYARWTGTWSGIQPVVPPGLVGMDRNPDIASSSGSHTMPPQP